MLFSFTHSHHHTFPNSRANALPSLYLHFPGVLGGCGSIASEVQRMFSIIGTRRTKIFTYGFMLTIVACTVYIAFTPSTGSGGRTAGSPWFSSFFSNATASTRSYRSQFSTFISRFFNGSSESDGSLGSQGGGVLGEKEVFGSKKDGVLGRDQSNATVESSQNAIFAMNHTVSGVGSSRSRSTEKNMTGLRVEFLKGGILVKNQTSLGDVPFEKGMLVKKEASSGVMPSKSSVITEDQICSGIASSKDGSNLDKNLTCSSQNGISTKNQTISDVRALDNRGLANDKAKVETPASVLQQQTKVSPAVRKNETSQSNIALDLKTKMVSKNNTRVQASPARHNASPPAKNGNPAIAKEITNSDASGRSNVSNFLASSVAGHGGDKKREWSLESMKKCDIYKGGWVKDADESYPLYSEGSCPHIDEPFDCFHNGRLDRMYQKLRWQPDDCNIPRMNASDMLERLRGKRLVFVGDSLNRNMWESLVCILRNSITDKRKVFEASGRHEFRTEGSYSFLFKDYNCTVEFFRSPFLVQEWEMPDTNGKKKETLRLDLIERSSSKYKDANVIVFNTGHWWTHEKTSKGKDYYQEGNQVYNELNVANAFHKALNTWAKWIDVNINPHKTLVVFRGYSASHFRGGQWNSGGQCDKETEPIKNEKFLSSYPPKMSILESVLKEMKTPVSYLNITRLTDYRKDAHPSVYRKQKLTEEERRSPERYQDCSHWCLPGVPDSWNELLYIQLVLRDIK